MRQSYTEMGNLSKALDSVFRNFLGNWTNQRL